MKAQKIFIVQLCFNVVQLAVKFILAVFVNDFYFTGIAFKIADFMNRDAFCNPLGLKQEACLLLGFQLKCQIQHGKNILLFQRFDEEVKRAHRKEIHGVIPERGNIDDLGGLIVQLFPKIFANGNAVDFCELDIQNDQVEILTAGKQVKEIQTRIR